MKNHIEKTHHRFTTIPQIIDISQPIKQQTGYIDFLGYGGVYDNGNDFHLTTNAEWAEYYSFPEKFCPHLGSY